jgi:LysR family hydrogen peroxide-inducible transcriptional activator
MDLRQLAALVAIADHGSFSSAARALYTVQSNVSAHVSRLERELGVRLVDRGRGALTEEGRLVVARARRIQHELDALHADLAGLRTEVAGEARVGVIGTTARWLMPQVLTALREHHPHVRAIVVEASTTSLLPQLVAGDLDVAVVNLPVDNPDVDADPLFDEDMVLLIPGGHALAGRTTVELGELADHQIILSPPGTALRQELDESARRAGVTLQPAAEIDGVRLLTSMAFEGFGATIVPATAVPGWVKGNFTRARVPGLPTRQVGLARRRRSILSAPGRAVAEVLTDVVVAQGPRQPGVHVLATPGAA